MYLIFTGASNDIFPVKSIPGNFPSGCQIQGIAKTSIPGFSQGEFLINRKKTQLLPSSSSVSYHPEKCQRKTKCEVYIYLYIHTKISLHTYHVVVLYQTMSVEPFSSMWQTTVNCILESSNSHFQNQRFFSFLGLHWGKNNFKSTHWLLWFSSRRKEIKKLSLLLKFY